jgi:hypothetical protein
MIVTSAVYHFWKSNWTKILVIFFPYLLIILSDTHLHVSHDTVQTWVKEPGVYIGRFGLFEYSFKKFNLKSGCKSEIELAF